jgi:hypothetical protein
MNLVIRDNRQMRAVTGLSFEQFDRLLEAFKATYEQMRQEAYEKALESGQRSRRLGGGRKGALPTLRDKLFFVLCYYKSYPTFDMLGAQFNLSRSKANENLHRLSAILRQTLADLEVLPHREFATPEEMARALEAVEVLLIDGTERPHQRPQEDEKQQDLYSGKKTPYPEEPDHLNPEQVHSLCQPDDAWLHP